ncbi:RICIN domain-containing protein [Nostoc sp. MS1]|uniref:RICIN domain-containing protein n=1 Tax=Nostoc sp. MS1 TaxID=2764711 RepID=UPI001CC4B81C|nr:RICIN domain-containing protein [Nostoc sp. MS1]BCL40314.1 hypothetical protein NSMS1_67610 [Nostoc sp. MS1]
MPNDKVDHFKWQLQDAGDNYFYLVAKHSDQALAVNGGLTANGTKIVQSPNEKSITSNGNLRL